MTLKVYKLTDQDLRTYKGYKWAIGEWREAPGEGELCSDGWLHCYSDPLIACLLNPIHANISNPRLWEADADGRKDNHGLKLGVQRLRLVRELEVPEISVTQRVAFGILCAREVCDHYDPEWRRWAKRWLGGADRSGVTARAAETAARAAGAAAGAAAWAAEEEWAAKAAEWAAWAVIGAAAWAAEAGEAPLDLPALARKAMEVT